MMTSYAVVADGFPDGVTGMERITGGQEEGGAKVRWYHGLHILLASGFYAQGIFDTYFLAVQMNYQFITTTMFEKIESNEKKMKEKKTDVNPSLFLLTSKQAPLNPPPSKEFR